MLYKTEKDLQLDLASLDLPLNDTCKVSFVRREVPVGNCIPDLVCIRFYEFPSELSWPSHWSSKHSYVVWLLRQWSQLNLDRIAALSFEKLDRIIPIIKDLVNSGIVVENGYGNLILSDHIASLNTEVIVAEAKLQRWREAITQAERYKDFGDRVFVAMDPIGIPREQEVIDVFEGLQIGLCAVSPDNIEWLVYPPLANQSLGYEHEYLVTSAMVPSRQIRWSIRYAINASSQA